VSSQLYALSPRKDLPVPIEQETGWVPEIFFFWGGGNKTGSFHRRVWELNTLRHFNYRKELISRTFAFVVKGLSAFITASKLTVGRIGTGSRGKWAGLV
jgi:hypothetical protein